jgi:radical SAM superfamily enzyme YgiQ (UPF0313 family)
MQILLLSMPDSFEHTPALAIRMPNGALASLAGNVDAHHDVAIADLILTQRAVEPTVERLLADHRPDVVGLSVMTFQRATARRIIGFVRARCPAARIVVGGYDPSLAPEAWIDPRLGVDVIVRGEGDVTFREVMRAFEFGTPLAAVPGIWYRDGGRMHETAARPPAQLAAGDVRPPRRGARVLAGYTFLGRPVDVVETSRGCTFDCSFCSIIAMRGRNFHRYALDRVLHDIADARARGARAIFLVDDNVTIDVPRLAELCRAIADAGLNDVDYLIQAMTAPLAAHGERLAPLMRRAGFRYVFLGIENILARDLTFLNASAKNSRRQDGRTVGNATLTAIDLLHRHGLFVVGGLIVGTPEDDRAAIEANLAFASRHVDWPYIQHPTPYPGTPMTGEFKARNLIQTTRVEEYDGTTAVTRSAYLDAGEIEFMRWRAERWMKVRHLPAALAHHPGFVLRHGARMLAHTFRGSSWRSTIGLETARDVFTRYKAIRARERRYVRWPDPLADPPRTPDEVNHAVSSAAG